MNVISHGNGRQTIALLVLLAQGKLDQYNFEAVLFCNVGDDSESPQTLRYYREVTIPYARKHGINLIELHKERKGKKDTILENLLSDNRSIGIPVYMNNGAPGNRSCTVDYKVKVVEKWLRENNGYPAKIGIGFSLDEFKRISNKYDTDKKQNIYPLIDMRLTLKDCMQIIEREGLPIPPESSCYFCPFHSMQKWQQLRENDPLLFDYACIIEEKINKKRRNLERDNVWLSRKLIPLRKATTDLRQLSFDDDMCDNGYCFL